MFKYPNNDDLMIYDYNLHRYVLTEQAYYTYLGINFGEIPLGMDANPSAIALREARRVSDSVYRYLTKDSQNPDWLVYELATVPKLRSEVFQMLIKQAEYVAESGNLEAYSGVDAFNGVRVDREKIREVLIAPAVEDIAYKIQPSIGRCLKYAGSFGYCAPDYTDDDGNPVY